MSLAVRSIIQELRSSATMIEHTPMRLSAPVLEPKNHDRAHATYSRVFRVALTAIANLLAPWDIGEVTCVRAHTLRSSALRSSAPSLYRQLTFSINMTTCVNLKTYVLWAPFESLSLCLALLIPFNCQTLLA
jgi:hypothetical protein